MSMYDNFKTDSKSEKEGVWLDYGEFRILICRAGGANKAYQKKLDRLTRPYRRAIATESLDPDVSIGLLHKAYAHAVIKSWETKDSKGKMKAGIEQPDGSIAPVTKAALEEALKALPDLFMDIKEQAEGIALFRAALREEASEN